MQLKAEIAAEQQTAAGRATYANSINLTPGTVSLELTDNEIEVHVLSTDALDDLIDGITKFMNSSSDINGPINLGNNSEFTMIELAEKVLKLTGSKSKLIFKPLPSDDPRQRQPDLTKAKADLSWEPSVSLDDGLKETINYFKKIVG